MEPLLSGHDPPLIGPAPLTKSFVEAVTPTTLEPSTSPKCLVTRDNGLPSIHFLSEEYDRYSLPFKYTLVGTFWHGRPNMKQ